MQHVLTGSILSASLGLALGCGGGARCWPVKGRGTRCLPAANGTSSRAPFDVTRTGDSTLTYSTGFAPSAGPHCTGTLTEPPLKTPMGTVTFLATEHGGDVSFNRGTWVSGSGLTAKVLWALREERILRALTDPGALTMGTPEQVAACERILSPGPVKP